MRVDQRADAVERLHRRLLPYALRHFARKTSASAGAAAAALRKAINRLPLVLCGSIDCRWSAGPLGALGSATYLFPPLAMTDALFAELRRPHDSYPALIPPVIAWSLMLRSRLAGLPFLPRVGGRLDGRTAQHAPVSIA